MLMIDPNYNSRVEVCYYKAEVALPSDFDRYNLVSHLLQ